MTDDLKAKARIRTEALKLFAAHGEAGVTIRQIAAKAGVAHGLVVHHFKTKSGLREAVETYIIDQFRSTIEDIPQGITSPKALAQDRDARVNRLLQARPEIVDYMRRALLTGAEEASSFSRRLAQLTLESVRRLKEAGLASSRKPDAVTSIELLVRYFGTLFLTPMLTSLWSELSADTDGLPTPTVNAAVQFSTPSPAV